MAETHPDYDKHMTERQTRIGMTDERNTPSPPPWDFPSEAVRPSPEDILHYPPLERHPGESSRNRPNIRWPGPGHGSRDHDGIRHHHAARNSARDLVRDAVMSDNPYRSAIVEQTLEGCKATCQETGLTFAEVLGEDMEGVGVPPLVYEIFSCWEDPGLLEFLLENTPARCVEMFVRKGCMMRGDNGMFQGLRATLSANETIDIVPYNLSLREEPEKFHVEAHISDVPLLLEKLRTPADERKGRLPSPVEWIAAGRLWSIEPTSLNTILLRLIEGDPIHLTAIDLTITARNVPSSSTNPARRNSMAVSMMKDKSPPVTLVPLSQSGINIITFIPFSPMEDRLTLPACLSADSSLSFQLSLSFSAATQTKGSDTIDDEDDEDWEHIPQEKEWVLASWSGKDDDAEV